MDVPPVTDVELRTEYTATELTAAGEQVVIPGAERISDRELAQRKMDDLLTGRTDPMPEGSLSADPVTIPGPKKFNFFCKYFFDRPNLVSFFLKNHVFIHILN